MSTPNHGGPAFPVHSFEHQTMPDGGARARHSSNDGMTLRDWFAGQALEMSHEDFATLDARSLALNCYDLADAMLVARARKEGAQ